MRLIVKSILLSWLACLVTYGASESEESAESLLPGIRIASQYNAMLNKAFNRHRSYLSEFELVLDPTQKKFDKNGDWDISVDALSGSDAVVAIAVLHDYQTGKALDACITPCELKGYRHNKYRLSFLNRVICPMCSPFLAICRNFLSRYRYKLY
jgi:hypothetical protein